MGDGTQISYSPPGGRGGGENEIVLNPFFSSLSMNIICRNRRVKGIKRTLLGFFLGVLVIILLL